MEKYKFRSVEELAETLKRISVEGKSAGLSSELREFVSMLKAHKLLRHRTDAHTFCKCGGLQVLLELLSQCEGSTRDMVIVLGTVGNLCALDSNSRNMVMNNGVLEKLVGYLQESTNPDAIGTVARLLANLALDPAHISTLHKHAVVQHLLQLLAQGSIDINCRKNIVRALRLLCSIGECLEELKQSDGVPLLLECLKSEHVELVVSALQAVEVVSREGDQEVLRWLCNKETMQSVVRYCNHCKPKVKHRAMNVLLNAAQVLDGRMALSSAAGVETMVAFMESTDKNTAIFRKVVCALCTCCRDVISRQRLRDCGGLERLITMLADPSHISLHGSMMAALVCYYFDETTLKLMVTKMGLLQTLSYHLRELTSSTVEQSESANLEISEDDGMVFSPGVKGEEDVPEMMESSDHQPTCLNMCSLPSDSEDQCPSPRSPSTGEHLLTTSPPRDQSPLPPPSKHPSTTEDCMLTTPPPSKRPRLEEPDEDSPSATPTNFLDSLLSSPNPYQTPSPTARPLDSPLTGGGLSTFESQVIMMVSRVSHMRDCVATLSYPDTLLALLHFFASSTPPNIHISKVLTRVFMNPHCFQNCVTSLIPSKLHKIIRRSEPPPPPSLAPPSHNMSGADFHRLCRGLLEHIMKNAESPYGQGVLAHLLLRGSDKDKQASCLSMPLLCRSPRVCQKLMIDYGAFALLCELLRDESQPEQWEMALDSMLALGHNMHTQQVPRHRRRYSILPPELQLQARKFPFSRLNFSFKDLSLSDPGLLGPSNPTTCRLTHCRYLDTDFYPFDLTMILHSPLGQTVRVPAHKSTLIEGSDVFRVMFAGSYKESSCCEVHIHSISPHGFLSVLHHMYGCGWQCKEVLNTSTADQRCEGRKETVQPDLLSETTEILLQDIGSVCQDGEERDRTEHCLQVLACAGRFLLPDLITHSEHAAAKALQPGNLVAMFHFAQLHQCFCLAESCIRTLVTIPHLQLRTEVFRELLKSTEGEAALQIILLFLTTTDL